MSILEKLIREDFKLTTDLGRYNRGIDHDSLVYDSEKDLFYWNSKGIHGNAYWYLVQIRGMSGYDAKKFLKSKYDTSFFDTFPDSSVSVEESDLEEQSVIQSRLVEIFYEAGKSHRSYWHDVRGYTDRTIKNFRLGYSGEWYTIPIYVDGVFKNFQARKILSNGRKFIKSWYSGVGPLPFNFSILRLTDWVVIAEGPPDAIMLRQNDIPAVSQTWGAKYWNPAWNEFFSHIKKFFILYDNDLAGNEGAIRVGQQWGGRASIYNFWDFDEKTDVTDYFKNGGTSEELINLALKNGKLYYEVEI